MTSGWQGAPQFQDIRPGAGFENRLRHISLKKRWGGARTVKGIDRHRETTGVCLGNLIGLDACYDRGGSTFRLKWFLIDGAP